jgi:hypothetical protein
VDGRSLCSLYEAASIGLLACLLACFLACLLACLLASPLGAHTFIEFVDCLTDVRKSKADIVKCEL